MSLPPHWRPFHLAGEAAAQFHAELFNEVMRKDLEYLQQYAIAQLLAELQVNSANWGGYCAMADEVDAQAGYWCKRLAGANYQEALRRIREAHLNHRVMP